MDLCTLNSHQTTMLLQFFSSDARIKAMRQMIMADTAEARQQALDLLLPYQRTDFEGIFRAMDGIDDNHFHLHNFTNFNTDFNKATPAILLSSVWISLILSSICDNLSQLSQQDSIYFIN